jgi:hypothetical protein
MNNTVEHDLPTFPVFRGGRGLGTRLSEPPVNGHPRVVDKQAKAQNLSPIRYAAEKATRRAE